MPGTNDVSNRNENGIGGEDFLLIKVGSYRFALDIGQISEVVSVVKVTPVPKAPEFIAGAINYRGEIISVVDLGALLDASSDVVGEQAIIICQHGDGKVGVLVDEATRVLAIAGDDIEDIDAIHPLASFVAGAVNFEESLVLIFSMADLLSSISEDGSVYDLASGERALAKESG
ncbi:MAG: chemotaxis protein CheW [Terriglobia bacterium]